MPKVGTSAGTYSYSQLRKLWIQAGGNRGWSYVMAAIALAESGGNPRAKNVDANGSVDYGLWQINTVHNYSVADMENPQQNAKEAVAVFNSSGPHAWSTYNNGSYKKFLPSGKSEPKTDWSLFKSGSSVDQGVDFVGKGPIPALDNAKVTDVGHVNIIEGGTWPEVVYKLTAGPYRGHFIYTMENFEPAVKSGENVVRGQTIGVAKGRSPYIETGFNKQAKGINPVAPLYPDPHSPKPAGMEMQAYIKKDVGQGGGVNVGGIVGDIGTGIGIVTDPAGSAVDFGLGLLGKGASAVKKDIVGGLEGLILQGFFILIGIGLIVVGLGLVAWTVMGKIGAPGVVGMAQSQMRINQASRRIGESNRASTVRESQAGERIQEQREARALRERSLKVREGNLDRRQEKYVVKDKPNQVIRKKPGKKATGSPRN